MAKIVESYNLGNTADGVGLIDRQIKLTLLEPVLLLCHIGSYLKLKLLINFKKLICIIVVSVIINMNKA